MKFSYAEYFVDPSPAAPNRYSVFRPVIRVRMTGSSASRKIWALLDTGEDETYITEDLATKLGVVPSSEERGLISSASGEIQAWYGSLSIEITDGELSIIVGVVPQEWSEMILGHVGFFEYFDATFSDTDRAVELTRR